MENMQYDGAVRVIENCAGFTDITTSAGEAWEVVQEEVSALRAQLAEVEAQRDGLRDALEIIADDETDYPRVVAREALAKLKEK